METVAVGPDVGEPAGETEGVVIPRLLSADGWTDNFCVGLLEGCEVGPGDGCDIGCLEG